MSGAPSSWPSTARGRGQVDCLEGAARRLASRWWTPGHLPLRRAEGAARGHAFDDDATLGELLAACTCLQGGG